MKFIIKRASLFDKRKPPTTNFPLEMIDIIEKSPFGNEYIDTHYVIEINTLSELLDLYNKEGDLIIQKKWTEEKG